MKQVQRYLRKRREEILSEISDEVVPVFTACYCFIEEKLGAAYDEVTPDMVRKLELLEALLLSFIDHGMNLEMLTMMDKEMSHAKDRSRMVN